ncbi:MAG TPA: hypothetical protein VJV75_06780 [Candidatus Polarisedimenticolia bacterium]|nr:hypothetical protein [Candidatus Polarisedimenticolia bacterium]
MTHPARFHTVLRRGLFVALALVVPVLGSVPARAGDLVIDAGLSVELSDDTRFFLNLSNRQYAPPQPVAIDVLKRCPRPADDFTTVLFLAEAAHKSPGVVLDMRLSGRTWGEIMVALRVSPDVLFTGMDRDPGPPYGRAWGYWKKHRAAKSPWRLDDPDIVGLVKLQTVSSYYRVSPYRVTLEVQRGRTVEAYAVAHGRPPMEATAKNKGKGKGKSHANPHHGGNQGQPAPYAPQVGPHRNKQH